MNVVSVRRNCDEGLIPEEIRANQFFPVEFYDHEHELFFCSDQSLAFCFECQPLPGADENTKEKLEQILGQEFPADTVLSFFLFRSPDLEERLDRMASLRDGFEHPVLKPISEERINFLRYHGEAPIVARSLKQAVHNVGYVMDLKLIISLKIPFENQVPSEADVQQAKQWCNKLRELLKSVGFMPRQMDDNSYLRLMQSVMNWGSGASWKSAKGRMVENDELELNKQILDPDTSICVANKDGLQFGDNCFVKVLSAKRLPEFMFFGEAMQYIGDLSGHNQSIRNSFAIACNVVFPDKEKMKASLEKKRQWVTNQAYGPLLKFVPILNDKKNSFDIMYESLNKGARPLRMSLSLVLFGDSEKSVTAASMAAQSFWSTLRFKMMEDRFIMLPMFLNCLPMGADRKAIFELQRYKTMTSKELSVLLPILGEWKGTGTPHVGLLSRNGQLMSLSLHDTSSNKNCVIAAESGSGKSFLLNEIILSYMSEGARVWVVDAGKSYKKLCDSLYGDFIEFGESSKICLNPFQTIENWDEEEDMVVALISTMASDKERLSDLQNAELRRMMKELWNQHGQSMNIDMIRDKCLASEDSRVVDIGVQLYAFTTKGGYGRFFNGQNTVSFGNDFTVLELDELQGRKHLRQVVLLQLIYQIQREMYLGERNRKKLVIIDEAWDLIKEGEISVFMEHAYRKFRKYGGSAIIATQSVSDLYDNQVGRAIAENSATMLLLGQKRETIEAVKEKKYLVLPPSGFEMAKSVHTEAGVYSEIFLYTERGMGIGRLVVSDFQKLLYSTAAEDVHAIDQYRNQGLTIQEAILSVMRDRRSLDLPENAEELKSLIEAI